MRKERNVPFAVFFKLFKGRRPFGLIGLIFTCLSLFVFLPLVTYITLSTREPYENYDLEEIQKDGIEKTATITSLDPLTNVSINGANPVVISYSYEMHGMPISDKFQTMDLKKVNALHPGDKVTIRTLNKQSYITGFEPYSLPVLLFFLMPLIFFIVGISFFLLGLLPALKLRNLYRYGIVKDATIISMAPYNYLSTNRRVNQAVKIDYYFTGHNNTKIFGDSATDEYSILNEKKSGDVVKIFVDEQDESKNCLVPKLEALKYNWDIN